MKQISIIIPLYNSEQYIWDCLQSIKEQIFKEYEVIVVDDGSTDASLRKVIEFQAGNSMDIKIIMQENQGVSAARNKGLEAAGGEYVCFVDSDDRVWPRYLDSMIRAIREREGCDGAFCEVLRSRRTEKMNAAIKKEPFLYYSRNEILTSFLLRRSNLVICAMLVKRELLLENKLCFRPGYAYGEDLEMLWKILSCIGTAAYTKEKLYFYRVHQGSAMTKGIDSRKDGFDLMKELEGYFEAKNLRFSKEYKQYGVARWVWGNLRQLALHTESYKEFSKQAQRYSTKAYLHKLIRYPQAYVRISSMLYVASQRIYYMLFVPIKLMIRIRNGIQKRERNG